MYIEIDSPMRVAKKVRATFTKITTVYPKRKISPKSDSSATATNRFMLNLLNENAVTKTSRRIRRRAVFTRRI